jgi:hypothetical protein
MYKKLPSVTLDETGSISSRFFRIGIDSYHDACGYIWKLPYGRTSDSKNWSLVLTEKRGTCSTKHALLKALADELTLDIDLILGIYYMSEANTPGVGKVLDQSEYVYIPEAHCYLKYNHIRVDLTRFGLEAAEPIAEFYDEVKIKADDIGTKKLEYHQSYIKKKFGHDRFDHIWELREQCISAIST